MGIFCRTVRADCREQGGDAAMKIRRFKLLMVTCCLLAYTCTAVQATDDPGWPREHTGEDGTKLLVYQPQVDSWEEQRRIHARVAVALTPPQGEKSILGILWIE